MLREWEETGWVQNKTNKGLTTGRMEDVGRVTAFAVVRHPVTRFVSAYGTVINRLVTRNGKCNCLGANNRTHEMNVLLSKPEPERFNDFVVVYKERGIHMADFRDHCMFVLNHVFSQTFYLNYFPGPIAYLGHAEDMEKTVEDIGKLMGVNLEMEFFKPS